MSGRATWPDELFILRGATPDALVAGAAELRRAAGTFPLAELARRWSASPRPHELALAVVADSAAALGERLDSAAERIRAGATQLRDARGAYYSATPLARTSRLAFVFPGDGSPYLNMLAELHEWFPELREWFDTADRAATQHGHAPLREVVYPGEPPSQRERLRAEHRLRRLENSSTAVLAGNQALYTLLGRLGVKPQALIGHSLGDWSALAAAGVTSIERFLDGVEQALLLPGHVTMGNARMALALATRERAEQVLAEVGDGVYIAMHNGPRRLIIAGTKQPVGQALAKLSARGATIFRLPFVRAAHTPLADAIRQPLREAFADWGATVPELELWSCTAAQPYPADIDAIRELAVANIVCPVEFMRTIEAAYQAGIRLFAECGAGGQLTDCVDDILGHQPHLAVAVDARARHGITQLNHLLGALAAEGVPVDPARLYEVRGLATTPAVVATTPAPGARDPRPVQRFLTEAAAAMAQYQQSVQATLAANDAFTKQYLSLQEQVMGSFLRGPEPAVSRPFIDEVVALTPGRSATAQHRLDPQRQPYLRDHALGGFAPEQPPAAGPLLVAPLTVSLEIMAEAASLLFGGQPLRAIADVVARRPVSAEGEPTIELRVKQTGPGEAFVVMADPDGPDAAGYAEGRFTFGPLDMPPPAEPFALQQPRPTLVPGAELYAQRVMFHGPCFQGVSHLTEIGDDGITGRLRSLPRGPLFGRADEPPLLLDAQLLDAMGQIFGYWPLECCTENVVVFPAMVQRFDFYAPPSAPGEELETRVRLVEQGTKRLVGNIDLVRDGRVVCRVTRWRFWRFNWPLPLVHSTRSPAETWVGQTLAEQFGIDLPGVHTAVLSQPRPLELLPFLVRSSLSAAEYQRFRELNDRERQAEMFYLGRLAAKEALRRWAHAHHGRRLYPNLIDITNDDLGAPQASGPELTALGPTPTVSLAHKPGLAAGAAADGPVGVDVEAIAPRDEGFLTLTFTSAERRLVGDSPTAVALAWCAKEAAGKALGTGLSQPKQAVLEQFSPTAALVRIGDQRFAVRCGTSGDWACALARPA